MPLLTARHGFEPWYLAMLPERIRDEALVLCEEQSRAVEVLGLSPEKAQYYLAFGYRVVCECAWGLPSAVYVAEMRSGQTVHPTLRRIAQALGTALQAAIPEMALHIDNKPEAFSQTWRTGHCRKSSEAGTVRTRPGEHTPGLFTPQ